jgi:hypothetical protein
MVETVGIRQVMWFVMLESAKVSCGKPGRVTTPTAVPWPLLHHVSLGE